jgi:hypothetical protein
MKLSKLQVEQPQPCAACLKRYLPSAGTSSTRHLSNVVYALCKAPQVIRQQHQAALQQLVPAFMEKCAEANAQDISNVLYGMADSGQQWPEEAVQQLLSVFVTQLHQVKPQNVSNSLWAVAKLGQQVLIALVNQLHQAKPQNLSNALWAVASMGQQVPAGQRQQLLDAFVGQLHQANPQDMSNTLLACGKLGFLPQRLLAAGTPQDLANAAWACGQLGHRDEQLMAALLAEVQQRLAAAGTSSSRSFNSQELCNLCWAVAVLDLQQHVQQVLQLGKACGSMWSSIEVEGQQQLWQVHTWLLDFHLAEGQGLQGSLTQQQLQQCRAAWDAQLQQTAKQRLSDFQRSVFAAVQRLPMAWQQPQMEQLSVGRGGVAPDGALLIDIAGRTADGVLVAVEADGPTHFRQPDEGLTGPTQYKNRALAVRGYRLVSVPESQCRSVKKDEQGRDQYLMQLFTKAGLVGALPTATPYGQPPAAAAGAAAAGSTSKAVAKALLRRGGLSRQESSRVRKQSCLLLCQCSLGFRLRAILRVCQVLQPHTPGVLAVCTQSCLAMFITPSKHCRGCQLVQLRCSGHAQPL